MSERIESVLQEDRRFSPPEGFRAEARLSSLEEYRRLYRQSLDDPEKFWGAVAEAIKSIAEQRGWNHQGHRLLDDIVLQLSEEWDRPDVRLLFDTAERLHINFYEDALQLDAIATRVSNVKDLLRELQTLRAMSPRPVVLDSRERRLRWRRLTEELLPLGSETDARE